MSVARPSAAAVSSLQASPSSLLLMGLLLGATAGWATVSRAQETSTHVPIPSEYRLSGYVPGQVPEPGHNAADGAPEFFYTLPSAFTFDSLAGINPDAVGGPLDHARATLRYTLLSHPSWTMKVGLTTTLEPDTNWQRLLLAASDRPRLVPAVVAPTMHLSGEGQLSEHWLLTLDADGQRWAGNQALDLDLRINYHLTPGFSLFGSYRLSDTAGESSELYGLPVSNSARFGVRLRF